MNTDSYFEIGATHNVCEDYAIHGQYEDLHYVIGSDGCSSSDNVDVGARLLCHVAKKQIIRLHKSRRFFHQENLEDDILRTAIIDNCMELKTTLRLADSVFDATLWIAVVTKEKVFIFGWGDGVIIINDNDKISFIELNYDSGAPYYLSYYMNFERNDNYKKEMKGNLNIYNTWKPETSFLHNVQKSETPFVREFERSNIKSITICSDGISTYEKEDELINVLEMAKGFVTYKSKVGQFVNRRMLKLKREDKKNNVKHLDDIFCATINLEE